MADNVEDTPTSVSQPFLRGVSKQNLAGIWEIEWYNTVWDLVDAAPTGQVQFTLSDGRLGFVTRDASGQLQAYLEEKPCDSLYALVQITEADSENIAVVVPRGSIQPGIPILLIASQKSTLPPDTGFRPRTTED